MLKLSFLCFKNFSKTFSTESAQKPTICDLLFLIAIFSSRNDNKIPQQLLYYNRSFSRSRTYSYDSIDNIDRQISPNIFLFTNYPTKIKISQAQSNWFGLKETNEANMNSFKWIRRQLRTVILWDFFFLYLSLLKVTPETESIQFVGCRKWVWNNNFSSEVLFPNLRFLRDFFSIFIHAFILWLRH